MDIDIHQQMDRQMVGRGRERYRQADRQMDKQAGRQVSRQGKSYLQAGLNSGFWILDWTSYVYRLPIFALRPSLLFCVYVGGGSVMRLVWLYKGNSSSGP